MALHWFGALPPCRADSRKAQASSRRMSDAALHFVKSRGRLNIAVQAKIHSMACDSHCHSPMRMIDHRIPQVQIVLALPLQPTKHMAKLTKAVIAHL